VSLKLKGRVIRVVEVKGFSKDLYEVSRPHRLYEAKAGAHLDVLRHLAHLHEELNSLMLHAVLPSHLCKKLLKYDFVLEDVVDDIGGVQIDKGVDVLEHAIVDEAGNSCIFEVVKSIDKVNLVEDQGALQLDNLFELGFVLQEVSVSHVRGYQVFCPCG